MDRRHRIRDVQIEYSTKVELGFLRSIEILVASLGRDTLRLRAVERSLSILGEAAKRVPADLLERHPAIPWRAFAGLRDVLVHDYFGVDLGVVEEVIREEVPKLRIPNTTSERIDDTRAPRQASRRPNGCRHVAQLAA